LTNLDWHLDPGLTGFYFNDNVALSWQSLNQ